MAAITIRETIVTPDKGGSLVQLYISDAARESVDAASTRLTLAVRVGAFEPPLLAQLQREAMKEAQDILSRLLQDMAREIQESGHDLNPKLKK